MCLTGVGCLMASSCLRGLRPCHTGVWCLTSLKVCEPLKTPCPLLVSQRVVVRNRMWGFLWKCGGCLGWLPESISKAPVHLFDTLNASVLGY